MMSSERLVPPDGGWGWVIAVAFAVFNSAFLPIQQSFGLIFKESFDDLGLSAQEMSIVINFNAAFGMLMGVVNGPLLRTYGYRKVSLVASILLSTGVILTAYANKFRQLVITYGFIASLGMGIGNMSFHQALSSYFVVKRRRVIGIALAFTGIVSSIMPYIIVILMNSYGVKGTILILGGLCLHSIPAAVLLQPVKWHMKEVDAKDHVEIEAKDKEAQKALLAAKETAVSDEADKTSTTNKEKTAEPLKIVAETSFLTSLWQNIVKIFDLTLLKDWTYINILVGFALGQFTAVNFSILTPFIMSDLGLNMSQIATFMSTISVVDVMFRLLSPYIGDYFKRSSREMILLCMLLMICGRQALLMVTDYKLVLLVAAELGISKGFRTVYAPLVLTDYFPIKRLPSAMGIQMVANGLTFLLAASLMGKIRDNAGSYVACVHALNAISAVAAALWIVELGYKRTKGPRKRNEGVV